MQCLALSLEKLRVIANPQTHKPTVESNQAFNVPWQMHGEENGQTRPKS